MDFYIERKRSDDGTDEVISFRGEVRISDLIPLSLDRLDRALMDDVSLGKEVTAADKLLVLEMLFRRHTEHAHAERQRTGV